MDKNKQRQTKKPFYKKWWFWTIVILLIFGFGGHSNGEDSKELETPAIIETVPPISTDISYKQDIEIQTAIENTEIGEPHYADDIIVNKFISEYNSISESGFTEIKQGNIKTKYFAYSHGYYCELLNSNASGKICVTINETNENASDGVGGMRNIFRDVIKAIDKTIVDEEIYNCFDSLLLDGYLKSGISLGDAIITFCPDKELSNGYSRGHIEIAAK